MMCIDRSLILTLNSKKWDAPVSLLYDKKELEEYGTSMKPVEMALDLFKNGNYGSGVFLVGFRYLGEL